MSVFAAYMQVNTNIAEMETALQYLTKQMMPAIVPTSSLSRYAEEAIKKETAKEYILRYLQEADFNISNISSKEQETKKGVVNYTMYQHKVSSGLGGMITMSSRSCMNQMVPYEHSAWHPRYKIVLEAMHSLL